MVFLEGWRHTHVYYALCPLPAVGHAGGPRVFFAIMFFLRRAMEAHACIRMLLASGCGTRRRPAGTLRTAHVWALDRAPLRVFWASKVARAGSFSRECIPPRRAAQDHENLQFHNFSFCSVAVYVRPSSPLVCGNHGTRAAALRAPGFDTATHSSSDSTTVCACMRAVFTVILRT